MSDNKPIQSQSLKAIKTLKEYDGPNPYIHYLKERYNKYKKPLSNNQERFIIDNKDVSPVKIDKIIEINDILGERLRKSDELSFTPERIYFDSIVSEDTTGYLILGKVKRNQEKNEFYWVPKIHVIDDPHFNEEEDIEVDFDKYEKLDKMGHHPYEHQKEGVKFLLKRKGTILADQMGLGKATPLDSDILTPDGWVKNKDLKIGDRVIGSNGKPTKVTGVFPQGKKNVYKLTFTDKMEVECCEDHLWSVKTPENNMRGSKPKTLSVKQMLNPDEEIKFNGGGLNEGRSYNTKTYYKMKNGDCKWYIPIVDPVEFNGREIIMDPYLLGCLLGDGTFRNNLGLSSGDKEIPDFFKEHLLNENDLTKNSKYDYNIIGESNKIYSERLEYYGLLGQYSDCKFIPDDYKYNTVNIRSEILKGLMDTDGYCSKEGMLQFYSTSKQLSDDVKELVQSLGGVARQSEKNPTYTHNKEKRDGKKCYILTLNLPEGTIPFKLERKLKLMNKEKKYHPSRGIKNIEFSRKEEVQCISVEAEDNLYVMDEYVVTHNTRSAIIATLEAKPEKVLIISPAGMKITWYREIENMGETDMTIVGGNKWDEAKFTIVNYDVLKNFHTPFSERKKKNAVINDHIMNAGFDMVIVDEAHMVKNPKSIRGKIVKEISTDNPTVERTWLLTGTPITSKPMDYFNLLKCIGSELTNDWKFFAKRYCKAFQIDKEMKNGKKKKVWITDGASNLEELSKRTKNLILRRKKNEVLDLPDKTITPIINELTNNERKEYDNLWEDYMEKRRKEGKKGNPNKQLVELTLLREFIANAGVPRTIEHADNILEQDKENKVIIFTTFQNEQDELAKHFKKKCVVHNGNMSESEKQRSVDDFQNKKNKRVFIGNIHSAGVGITLTASNYIIFNSFTWVPSDVNQAIDRAHRIGQKNALSVYFTLFKDTIDERVWDKLFKKTEIINKIIEGGEDENIFDIDDPDELIDETIEEQ